MIETILITTYIHMKSQRRIFWCCMYVCMYMYLCMHVIIMPCTANIQWTSVKCKKGRSAAAFDHREKQKLCDASVEGNFTEFQQEEQHWVLEYVLEYVLYACIYVCVYVCVWLPGPVTVSCVNASYVGAGELAGPHRWYCSSETHYSVQSVPNGAPPPWHFRYLVEEPERCLWCSTGGLPHRV